MIVSGLIHTRRECQVGEWGGLVVYRSTRCNGSELRRIHWWRMVQVCFT